MSLDLFFIFECYFAKNTLTVSDEHVICNKMDVIRLNVLVTGGSQSERSMISGRVPLFEHIKGEQIMITGGLTSVSNWKLGETWSQQVGNTWRYWKCELFTLYLHCCEYI
jgi:hypothetical protein